MSIKDQMLLRIGIFNEDLINSLFLIKTTNYRYRINHNFQFIFNDQYRIEVDPFSITEYQFLIDQNGEFIISDVLNCSADENHIRLGKTLLAEAIKNFIEKVLRRCSKYDEEDLKRGGNPNAIVNLTGESETFSWAQDDFKFLNKKYDLTIPIQWLWIAYDKLMGKDIDEMKKTYGKKMVEEAIGEPLTEDLIKRKNKLIMEISKIEAETKEKINKTFREYEVKRKDFKCSIFKKIEKAKHEEEKEIANVTKQFNELRIQLENLID